MELDDGHDQCPYGLGPRHFRQALTELFSKCSMEILLAMHLLLLEEINEQEVWQQSACSSRKRSGQKTALFSPMEEEHLYYIGMQSRDAGSKQGPNARAISGNATAQ